MPINYDNDKLKRPGAMTSFTPEMVMKVKRAMHDIEYFAEEFYYVVHPIKGKIKIPLYDFQKKLLKHYQDNRFSVVLCPRQSGKCLSASTLVKVRNKKTGEVMEITAKELFDMIKDENDEKTSL